MDQLSGEHRERELTIALALRLSDIAEEIAKPGYAGHGLVPRFFDEIVLFVENMKQAQP